MPKCQFTAKYYDYDYETRNSVDFNCQELPLVSGFCIFHDKDYLQDKTNNDEHKRTVLNRLKRKVKHAISDNEPLLCIGFQLPDSSLSDLGIISKEFTKPVYFSRSQFFGKANFSGANFQGETSFNNTNFQGEADFSGANFKGGVHFYETNFKTGEAEFHGCGFYDRTYFSGQFNSKMKFEYILFEGKEKVIIDTVNLSNVSFVNTDLTGVRFSDKARWGNVEYDKFWGGKKATEGKF